MAAIDVERIEEGEAGAVYRVVVREGDARTEHRVSVPTKDFERLMAADETGEAFVRRCFDFLLEREPKESIMARFDVMTIARYFQEFESTIGGSRPPRRK